MQALLTQLEQPVQPDQLTGPDEHDAVAALLGSADADLDALAGRLHDGVLQTLVVARYACDAVARGADPSLARDAVQEALVALRREVWMLRPRGAEGLSAALDDLSAQRTDAGHPGLALELDSAVRLSPPCTAAAYRLVQSAVVAHATTRVAVRLTAVGDDRAALELDVTLPDPATWSLRARALGGRLSATPATTLLELPTCEDRQ